MFSNVLYKRNVLVWWLFNFDNPSCIGRLFSINSTLRFLQCLSGHTCLQFIHSQKACFEANPMVTFLFKMVHSFRGYGLDGFGWHSENSNSAVTHFVMLPLPRFCVPSPYSAQRALCLHVFASPVMRVRWHSVLFVQIKICTHKKYNKCLYYDSWGTKKESFQYAPAHWYPRDSYAPVPLCPPRYFRRL